jgi:glycosyltransferase involved in cell wall biosynthesis
MIGEHFGMTVAEAMAAGLVPIVPSIGGPTEFVPHEYHYNTLEQAADIVSQAFRISYLKKVQISNSVKKFSTYHYIKGLKRIVNELLSQRK